MNKDNKFLTQGFLVYIIANCIGKASFTIKLVVYVGIIIFCVFNIIKAIREKSEKVAVAAMTSLLVFLIYAFGGIITKEYSSKYNYFYDSSISWVVRVLFALIMLILFGIYGYKNVDVDSRDVWLKNIKIFSIIFLILLCLIGLMYIIFPVEMFG